MLWGLKIHQPWPILNGSRAFPFHLARETRHGMGASEACGPGVKNDWRSINRTRKGKTKHAIQPVDKCRCSRKHSISCGWGHCRSGESIRPLPANGVFPDHCGLGKCWYSDESIRPLLTTAKKVSTKWAWSCSFSSTLQLVSECVRGLDCVLFRLRRRQNMNTWSSWS